MAEIEKREIVQVSQEQLVNYADISGDHNPIHLDEAVAKKSGLDGVIAHGMYLASLLVSEVDRVRAKETTHLWQLSNVKTRFVGMTFLNDRVSLIGTYQETDGLLEFNVKLVNQKDEVLLKGKVVYTASG